MPGREESEDEEISREKYQRELDTRALEIAAATREQAKSTRDLLDKLDQRMSRHEAFCEDERKVAAEQRKALYSAIGSLGKDQDVKHLENVKAMASLGASLERAAFRTQLTNVLGVLGVVLTIAGIALGKILKLW